jgi:MarR family
MRTMPATVTRAEVASELRDAVQAFSAAQRRLRSRDSRSGGLSIAQWHLLRQLGECDELAAGKLAAGADLTPASATQMLDHMAEQGWSDALSDIPAEQLRQAARVLRRMADVLDAI